MGDGRKDFSKESEMLATFCKERGYQFELRNPGPPTYQLARITGDGFSLIAYPHKTSAHNYHIRIRIEKAKDEKKAYAVIAELDALAGYNCTFQSKHSSSRYSRT